MTRHLLASTILLGLAGPAAADGWTSRVEAERAVAGTTVGGELAGLRLECVPGGPVRTVLSHNGRRFERGREATVVLSVDGMAQILRMQPSDSARAGDDDLSRQDEPTAAAALADALAAGRTLEISGPAGRYAMSLSGSSRALTALRAACGF